MQRVIFHIDVNSAFLSWTAVHRLRVLGEKEDLRELPAAVAGDRENRQGVILAKSIPAGKRGVKTGEPVGMALRKCPELKLVPPDYALYVEASRHFTNILRRFAPLVEQYSIDEAWADLTGTEGLYGPPLAAAALLRQQINAELGFTVNIGISSNKLLAKMAGDFEKPNKIHTLWPWELEEKLWPLPVQELFMLGPATAGKLHRMGIHSVGELAAADPEQILRQLHRPSLRLWHSANGRDSDRLLETPEENKGYGNSTTLAENVTRATQAYRVLLSLCETVGMRMRQDQKTARGLSVSIRSNQFVTQTHQCAMAEASDSTETLFRQSCRLFDELWDGTTPLRQLGVQVFRLEERGVHQYSLFDIKNGGDYEKQARLDDAIDDLRAKYGERILRRARFVGQQEVMAGGLSRERRTGITKPV